MEAESFRILQKNIICLNTKQYNLHKKRQYLMNLKYLLKVNLIFLIVLFGNSNGQAKYGPRYISILTIMQNLIVITFYKHFFRHRIENPVKLVNYSSLFEWGVKEYKQTLTWSRWENNRRGCQNQMQMKADICTPSFSYIFNLYFFI